MAVTGFLYNHTTKLSANNEINLANLRVKLLNNTPTLDPADVTVDETDNGTKAVVTMTIASPGVITHTAHGKSNGQPVVLNTTGALPTGLSPGVTYYIVNQTTNSYQLSATVGGAAIDTTGSQSGVHTAYYSGSYEVYGNGWPAGGPLLISPAVTSAAISDATANDAKLDAVDVSQTASGGSIGPAYKAVLYDSLTMYNIAAMDFGQVQVAGDTTDFKIRWHVNGIINWLVT